MDYTDSLKCIWNCFRFWQIDTQTQNCKFQNTVLEENAPPVCLMNNINLLITFVRRRYAVVFTALHVMQTRYSEENSVCPSVRPSVRLSVCHTHDPWQNGRKIGPDFYTVRKNIYPSFLRRRMVGGGDPFYVKFWVNRPLLERNRRFSTNNRS